MWLCYLIGCCFCCWGSSLLLAAVSRQCACSRGPLFSSGLCHFLLSWLEWAAKDPQWSFKTVQQDISGSSTGTSCGGHCQKEKGEWPIGTEGWYLTHKVLWFIQVCCPMCLYDLSSVISQYLCRLLSYVQSCQQRKALYPWTSNQAELCSRLACGEEAIELLHSGFKVQKDYHRVGRLYK